MLLFNIRLVMGPRGSRPQAPLQPNGQSLAPAQAGAVKSPLSKAFNSAAAESLPRGCFNKGWILQWLVDGDVPLPLSGFRTPQAALVPEASALVAPDVLQMHIGVSMGTQLWGTPGATSLWLGEHIWQGCL